ncbi:MAG: TrmB family transcriptional regulator [Promethearchaeota archaeon]
MKEDSIIKSLVKLGFLKNDAITYISLLKLKIGNPTEISKISKLHRARIYDSLKRLEEQGFVIKDIGEGRSKYIAINPQIVLKNIRSDLQHKVKITEEIEQKIQKKIQIQKETQAIIFQFDRKKVQSLTTELIQKANKRVYIVIPSFHITELSFIFLQLYTSPKNNHLTFSIILNSDHPILKTEKFKIQKNWNLSLRNQKRYIPFGLFFNDECYILLIFHDYCVYLLNKQEVMHFKSYFDEFLKDSHLITETDLIRESEFKHIIS